MTTTVAEETAVGTDAVRAVRVRRLGSLPLAIAFGHADIGEAELEDGRRVLITWGRSVPTQQQRYYSHRTEFMPVWCGADDGSAELIIGETYRHGGLEEWVWAGLRITSEAGPEWQEVHHV